MDWRWLIPIRELLLTNRWLRWLAPRFGHPKLWHWSRRGTGRPCRCFSISAYPWQTRPLNCLGYRRERSRPRMLADRSGSRMSQTSFC